MDPSRLALVQGMHDTRVTLRRWNRAPGPVVRGWTLGALAISLGLLGAVWLVGALVVPDPTRPLLPGLNADADAEAVGRVLLRNSLVLALHAMACVAGFIAGSSLPQQAEQHSGWYRAVHDRAGPLAIGFVVLATGFSLVTQAYALGQGAATLAAALGISELAARHHPAAPRAARARRPVPAARRLDDRQPRRPLARAARRDARHDAARRAGAGPDGVRRGLPLAGAPARRVAGRVARIGLLHFV